MGIRHFHLLFFILLLITSNSCRRYVCPTYQSTFMLATTPQIKYAAFPARDSIPFGSDERMMSTPKIFSPFEKSDTSSQIVPKGNRILAGGRRKKRLWGRVQYTLFGRKSHRVSSEEVIVGTIKKWNGLIARNKPLLFSKPRLQEKNTPHLIWAKTTFPQEIPQMIDSNTSLVLNPPKHNIEQKMYEIGFKKSLVAWEKLGESGFISTNDSLLELTENEEQDESSQLDLWNDNNDFLENFEDFTEFDEQELQDKPEDTENFSEESVESEQKTKKKRRFSLFKTKKKNRDNAETQENEGSN